ncbi:plasmolipin-like [Xenia sp. Carnegie-2017]|uniref:plasmolipin-like n=1 Tax=Xenia sp. Carnegie-2017 TaxID=2897299 RepID=UPI001F045699|nr:plasmolipin-like [Xenia sp. Carnegie-2017]
MGTIPKGIEFVKSVPFFLKIAAFVILLVAIGTLGAFLDKADLNVPPYGHSTFDIGGNKGSLDFGMFAIVVSWLVVIIMVVLFVTGLHEKVTFINWPLTVFINLVIWAVMLFIAGCVLADAARKYDNDKKGPYHTLCSYLKARNADARCGHLIGATICCFIATIIFAVDAFFNFQLFRGKAPPAQTSAPEKTAA